MGATTNGEAVVSSRSVQALPGHDRWVETVGRCGDCILSFEERRGLTELSSVHCRSPWHFLPPMALDGGRCAYTMLLNPSGGLVGGDRLSLYSHPDQIVKEYAAGGWSADAIAAAWPQQFAPSQQSVGEQLPTPPTA